MNRANRNRIPFPHPGETIREDYLKPLGLSVNKLALELRVPATRTMGGGALRPIRRFAWHAISTPRPSSG